jgi:hypothetical protein
LAKRKRPSKRAKRTRPRARRKIKGRPRAARKGSRSKSKKGEMADIDFYSYQKVFKPKPEAA